MSIIRGEVVPTPGARLPFKVVFKRKDGITLGNEVPVGSISEGEHVIRETLGRFTEKTRSTRPRAKGAV